jgi:hypothetical protein
MEKGFCAMVPIDRNFGRATNNSHNTLATILLKFPECENEKEIFRVRKGEKEKEKRIENRPSSPVSVV